MPRWCPVHAAAPPRAAKAAPRELVLSSSSLDSETSYVLFSDKQKSIGLDEALVALRVAGLTVQKIARYKTTGHKIELFYFLANSWFERAFSGVHYVEKLARWWGRDDWPSLKELTRDERKDALVYRLKSEFGLNYGRKAGGCVSAFKIMALALSYSFVQLII